MFSNYIMSKMNNSLMSKITIKMSVINNNQKMRKNKIIYFLLKYQKY